MDRASLLLGKTNASQKFAVLLNLPRLFHDSAAKAGLLARILVMLRVS